KGGPRHPPSLRHARLPACPLAAGGLSPRHRSHQQVAGAGRLQIQRAPAGVRSRAAGAAAGASRCEVPGGGAPGRMGAGAGEGILRAVAQADPARGDGKRPGAAVRGSPRIGRPACLWPADERISPLPPKGLRGDRPGAGCPLRRGDPGGRMHRGADDRSRIRRLHGEPGAPGCAGGVPEARGGRIPPPDRIDPSFLLPGHRRRSERDSQGGKVMAVLVTGGAGYIGSHTVLELAERGEEVVVLDNVRTGQREAVRVSAFYRGDVGDEALLDRIVREREIEAVIHFAACSLVGESGRDPLLYYENNVGGTLRLLKKMVEHGVKKFVFSSTAAVYGEPERTPISEEDPTNPTNPYGETKLAIERMLKWCDRAYGVKAVSLRYFNAAGAHTSGELGKAHDPETHLIPIVLQAALGKRECVHVYGDDYPTRDGTCIRDFVHVTDLAHAHWLSLEKLRR